MKNIKQISCRRNVKKEKKINKKSHKIAKGALKY